jgi:hypothetical protein
MKLFAEEDKKYKKIPKIEQKRSKRGASSYHNETSSWYDGYVCKIEDQHRKKKKDNKPPSSCHDEIHRGTIVQSPSSRKTINRALVLHNYSFRKIHFSILKSIQVS